MSSTRKTPARSRAFTARSTLSVLAAAATSPGAPATAAEPRAPSRSEVEAAPAKRAPVKALPVKAAPTAAVAPPSALPSVQKQDTAPAPTALRPLTKAAPRPPISSEERHRMIAKTAYGYAERSGFGTDPVANWLLAEREIDSMLARMAS